MKVTHLITTLDVGGAEMSLWKLLSRGGPDAEVICMAQPGAVAGKIRALGVPVLTLAMRRGVPNPYGLAKLGMLLRRSGSQVLQTWMYHADLLGGLAAQARRRLPVVWNIRQSNLSRECNKPLTLWTARLCARLSARVPARIVCCSESARRAHAQAGYAREKLCVIETGFDVQLFRPNESARRKLRAEWQTPEDAVLVGLVARFDPAKDHRTFIEAAARVARECAKARFILCGAGIEWSNSPLAGWIDASGCERERFRLLGQREDMPEVQAALDIACSSSRGEGLPGALAEAMAAGVPCVATRVGDSEELIADTGTVVEPGLPMTLATALREMIETDGEARRRQGEKARRRIEERFSLTAMAARYRDLYEEVTRACAA